MCVNRGSRGDGFSGGDGGGGGSGGGSGGGRSKILIEMGGSGEEFLLAWKGRVAVRRRRMGGDVAPPIGCARKIGAGSGGPAN